MTVLSVSDYMSMGEAARVLCLHPVSVRRLVSSGKLVSVKVGSARLVSRRAVLDLSRRVSGMDKHDPRRFLVGA